MILISLGSLAGSAFGEIHWFTGVLTAGVVGTIVTVTLASKFKLLEGAKWATVLRFSFVGFGCAWLVAGLNDLNEMLIIITGALGSGVGALLGKFLDRFFIDRPPQRLF